MRSRPPFSVLALAPILLIYALLACYQWRSRSLGGGGGSRPLPWKVELPLAARTIMAEVNQTVLMSLAMVASLAVLCDHLRLDRPELSHDESVDIRRGFSSLSLGLATWQAVGADTDVFFYDRRRLEITFAHRTR